MSKRVLSRFLALFGLVGSGCGLGGATATETDYVHAPTAELHKTWDLSQPELAPFTVQGVVVSPRIIPLNYDERAVKLLFGAPQQVTVSVERASIGAGAASRELPETPSVTIDQASKREGVWKAELTLGKLSDEELEALTRDGAASLTLHLKVGDQPARLAFDIEPKARTYVVSR